MPLPTDRAELLKLADASEAVIEQTTGAADPESAQKRAGELFRLGGIRRRLGDIPEAERILAEAADANLALGTPLGAERAAMSRVSLAAMAAKSERYREACEHIEGMIELNGGLPTFELTKQKPGLVLQLWLGMLAKIEEYERLYQASGVALKVLDPAQSPAQRVVLGQALALRARSANELGRPKEAVDLYERAIALLESEEPSSERDHYLNHALIALPSVLTDLDRFSEASDAVKQLEGLQGKHPLLKSVRSASRLWARWAD
jgi:tetratricopeptide (TPR) repeat protein